MISVSPATERGKPEKMVARFSAPSHRRPQQSANNKLLAAFWLLLFLTTFTALSSTMNNASATELAPQLYKTKLDNGLTVLVKETPATRVATVQIWIKAGSVYEDKDEGGITHLIEHMIFKGTPARKAGEVAGAIEGAGGRINAYTSFEYTVYHATLSSRFWVFLQQFFV